MKIITSKNQLKQMLNLKQNEVKLCIILVLGHHKEKTIKFNLIKVVNKNISKWDPVIYGKDNMSGPSCFPSRIHHNN